MRLVETTNAKGLPMIAQSLLAYTAAQFDHERMLVAVIGNYIVIDRLPMRDCGKAKNCRNRYQVINADQSRYYLCRSKAEALRLAHDLNRCDADRAQRKTRLELAQRLKASSLPRWIERSLVLPSELQQQPWTEHDQATVGITR